WQIRPCSLHNNDLMKRGGIGGEIRQIESHAECVAAPDDLITRRRAPESKRRAYPALRGGHVRTRIRESLPSHSRPRRARVSTTLPSAGRGHTNRPFSSRFANRHRPWPSHHSALSR